MEVTRCDCNFQWVWMSVRLYNNYTSEYSVHTTCKHPLWDTGAPSVFESVFVSQVCLCNHSFRATLGSPTRLFTTFHMWRFSCSTHTDRKSDPNRGVLPWRNYLLALTSIPPPSVHPSSISHCLPSIAPSLLLRSNIIWVQLTSLKSPGCLKRCELKERQAQGDR